MPATKRRRNGPHDCHGWRWRATLLLLCVSMSFEMVSLSSTGRAEAQASPSEISLQPGDVPGFSPVDPTQATFQDPNDQGLDQAFIQCAQGVPLLSAFDTGPDATVSQVYGEGTGPLGVGEPAEGVATAVFTDASMADASAAYSGLAGSSFQACWASTLDSLNAAQGITTPNSPTTVSYLPTPRYGAGSTGFVMQSNYSVLGQNVQGSYDFSVVNGGTVVVMLITYALDATFPDSLRQNILASIEQRMGQGAPAPAPPGPTPPPTPPAPTPPTPPTPSPASPTAPVQPGTYVALGDSYSSGEGSDWPPGSPPQEPGCDWPLYQDPSGSPSNTDHLANSHHFGVPRCFSPNPNDQRGDTCHRSITAYAHVVIRTLAEPGLRLDFVACSGDTTHDLITGLRGDSNHVKEGEHSQLAALNGSTTLVTLTIGGNDTNFAGIAKTCVTPSKTEYDCMSVDHDFLTTLGYDTTPGTPADGNFDPSSQGNGGTGLADPPAGLSPANLSSKLSQLASDDGRLSLFGRLLLIYRTIHKLAPQARILVLGYPRFFPASAPAAEHFSSQEAAWANDRIAVLDDIIHYAVSRSGVAQYVDVFNALNGHELGTGSGAFGSDEYDYNVKADGTVTCNGGAYINGIDLANGFFGSPELLHPNPCGHLAEGQIVVQALEGPIRTGPFTPPKMPAAGVIVVRAHHGNFPVGCHVTFAVQKVAAGSGYTWYDETGNQRATGTTLEMDSVHNAFALYLVTRGQDGQDRYSFFRGSVC